MGNCHTIATTQPKNRSYPGTESVGGGVTAAFRITEAHSARPRTARRLTAAIAHGSWRHCERARCRSVRPTGMTALGVAAIRTRAQPHGPRAPSPPTQIGWPAGLRPPIGAPPTGGSGGRSTPPLSAWLQLQAPTGAVTRPLVCSRSERWWSGEAGASAGVKRPPGRCPPTGR
jgi:hypothetical protein